MEKSQCYIGTLNGVVVCADCTEEAGISGRLYHGYREEGFSFRNLQQMLSEMEQMFDSIGYPHPSTDSRSFALEKQGIGARQERMRRMSDVELLSRHGDLGTFIVRVQHRQNSSWQGSITWTEQNKTIYFRSVWEMIKLIESAVDSVSSQEEEDSRVSWFESEEEAGGMH